jgi:hypothetical protein
VKLEVTRAFLMGGVVQAVGKRVEADDRLARELIATGKAKAAQELPAQAGPMTSETSPTLVKGKKEKPHAGQ